MVNGSQVVSWTHAGVHLGLILYYIISVADVPTLHAVSSGDLIVPRTHRQISNMASSVVTQRAWNRLPTELKLLFNGPFSGTTQVSQYQKGKTSLDLLKQVTVSGSGISWAICKSAPRSRQITTPASRHSVFYRPNAFLPPNQQCQSTGGI